MQHQLVLLLASPLCWLWQHLCRPPMQHYQKSRTLNLSTFIWAHVSSWFLPVYWVNKEKKTNQKQTKKTIIFKILFFFFFLYKQIIVWITKNEICVVIFGFRSVVFLYTFSLYLCSFWNYCLFICSVVFFNSISCFVFNIFHFCVCDICAAEISFVFILF